MRIIRKAIAVLGFIALGMAVAPPVAAQAATPQPAAALAAWDCPSGNLCVWDGTGGTGARCLWSDADPDWRSGITCSWSLNWPVRSVYNRGTSPAYRGVTLYQGANYVTAQHNLAQGVKNSDVYYYARSHRWQ
ncbi:peptidase inhibitor family I36 protein [Micromonospora sp. NPDC048947]|uniref:peptidase inhibitor family I36 protein n=1 Tax=Micromonospora sp. NPDC048947 TaxID=3154826 RepID=UPI0033D71E7A